MGLPSRDEDVTRRSEPKPINHEPTDTADPPQLTMHKHISRHDRRKSDVVDIEKTTPYSGYFTKSTQFRYHIGIYYAP